MFNINELKWRDKPVKYIKLNENRNRSTIVNSKKEKIYEYYKCDYCGDEIRLDLKQHERSGGIVNLPHSLTKCGQVTVALCNKCISKVQKELEERLDKFETSNDKLYKK